MTFEEALKAIRQPWAGEPLIALAEQVEANRKAIEELREKVQESPLSRASGGLIG